MADDEDYWFAPKRYGYGTGLPISWQGWLATALMLGIVFGLTFTLGACDGLRLLVIVDGNRQEGRDWAGLSRANRSRELELPLQLFSVLLSCAVAADVLGLSTHLTMLENVTGPL